MNALSADVAVVRAYNTLTRLAVTNKSSLLFSCVWLHYAGIRLKCAEPETGKWQLFSSYQRSHFVNYILYRGGFSIPLPYLRLLLL